MKGGDENGVGCGGGPVPSVSHLLTGVEELVAEAAVGLEQVGLDPARWLNGHFGAVLQDGHWELVARQAGEPQAEVPVHLAATLHVSTETHIWWPPQHQALPYPRILGHPQPDSTPGTDHWLRTWASASPRVTSVLGGLGQVTGGSNLRGHWEEESS